MGLLNPGGPIAQFKRNRCSISPVELILQSGVSKQLPRKYDAVLARYPYKRGKYLLEEEDFFQELVLHCEEAELSSGGTFLERACRKIDAELYEQVQKAYRLYNPHRNLYLDKCYGESKRPLSEWMDFTKYEK